MSEITERLAAIRARVDEATPGPWMYRGSFAPGRGSVVADSDTSYLFEAASLASVDPDTVFVAHAREDIPWLLAEVARLREALDEIACGDDQCNSSTGPGCDGACMRAANRALFSGD